MQPLTNNLFCMKQNTYKKLYDWYALQGRKNLPWRLSKDPYHIYLSEVMLQQTQVKTVLERFYFPFLEKFPSLENLANATIEEVLKTWQGLGYYSRARYLHQSAQQTTPALPDNVMALQALPGIGKNTAHAIAAFAYHQKVPVMEANVKRIIARFFALKNPTAKELWKYAQDLLDEKDPFTYNQAMMDIGALICTVKKPNCSNCPLNGECQGQENAQDYPQKITKKKVPTRHYHILIHYTNKNELHLAPRTTRFLHGMYGFDQQHPSQALPCNAKNLGQIVHHYSHFTLKAEIFAVPTRKKQHYTRQEINQLPLSGADEKALLLWDNNVIPLS